MEPVYENIEFCRDAETLWGKMREGRWDWLGVHPEGQFVLGSPRRRGGTSGYAALSVASHGAKEGEHGVLIVTEPRHEATPSTRWYLDEEAAKAAFDEEVTKAENEEGPVMIRVKRVADGLTVDERVVVSRRSTLTGVLRNEASSLGQ
jgi:hypothetical protein